MKKKKKFKRGLSICIVDEKHQTKDLDLWIDLSNNAIKLKISKKIKITILEWGLIEQSIERK